MAQKAVVDMLNILMNEMGVKGNFLAKNIGISYTFMMQVVRGERNFSSMVLESALEFLCDYLTTFEDVWQTIGQVE